MKNNFSPLCDTLSHHIFDAANGDCFLGAPTPHFKDDCPAEAVHFVVVFLFFLSGPKKLRIVACLLLLFDTFVIDLYFLRLIFFLHSLVLCQYTHNTFIPFN